MRYVKPGGWVEWHEKHPYFHSDDGSMPEDSAISQWGKNFFQGSKRDSIFPIHRREISYARIRQVKYSAQMPVHLAI